MQNRINPSTLYIITSRFNIIQNNYAIQHLIPTFSVKLRLLVFVQPRVFLVSDPIFHSISPRLVLSSLFQNLVSLFVLSPQLLYRPGYQIFYQELVI